MISGAGIVYHMSKKELEKMDHEAVENPEIVGNGNDIPLTDKTNGHNNHGYEEKL